jgi:hypothetical protein
VAGSAAAGVGADGAGVLGGALTASCCEQAVRPVAAQKRGIASAAIALEKVAIGHWWLTRIIEFLFIWKNLLAASQRHLDPILGSQSQVFVLAG